MNTQLKIRIIRTTLALFGALTISMLISWILGYPIKSIDNIDIPKTLFDIMSIVSYLINILFLVAFIHKNDKIHYFIPCMIYFILYIVITLSSIPSIVNGFVLPLVMFAFIIIISENRKSTILCGIIWLASFFVFGFTAKAFRGSVLLETMPFSEFIHIAIDMMLFFITMHLFGRDSNGLVAKHFLHSDTQSARNSRGQNLVAATSRQVFHDIFDWVKSKPLSTHEGRRVAVIAALQIFQVSVVVFVCWLGGVMWVGVVTMVAFIVYGQITPKRWHSGSVLVCTGTSAAMFYGLARALPPLEYSWFLPIVAGCFSALAFYWIECYAEVARANAKYRKEKERQEMLISQFKLERGCDRERMIEIAVIKDLDCYEISLLEHKYCKMYKNDQLAAKFAQHGAKRTILLHLQKAIAKFNS